MRGQGLACGTFRLAGGVVVRLRDSVEIQPEASLGDAAPGDSAEPADECDRRTSLSGDSGRHYGTGKHLVDGRPTCCFGARE